MGISSLGFIEVFPLVVLRYATPMTPLAHERNSITRHKTCQVNEQEHGIHEKQYCDVAYCSTNET